MLLKNQRVLVTGATGLLGTNLIVRLLAEGAIVRGTLYQAQPIIHDDRIEYMQADLTKADDCRRVVADQHYVFMCAASTSGAATIASTPLVHVTPNVLMNTQILEAAYEGGVKKFLWLSSTTGYPPSDDRPMHEDEMFQGDPYEKYYFVGWMKRFTEILCRMYGEKLQRTMTTIVLRPTNVYGIHDDFEFQTSHVIPALIRKVVERWDPIVVWGTGDDVRDVLYVDDMVEAMITAMKKIESHVAINIGLGKTYSVKQMLHMILDIDGYTDARIVFDPSKPTMIPKRAVNTTRAREMLGFIARTDLREGLAKTLEWYRHTRNIPQPALRT